MTYGYKNERDPKWPRDPEKSPPRLNRVFLRPTVYVDRDRDTDEHEDLLERRAGDDFRKEEH